MTERTDDLLAKHKMLEGIFSQFHGEVDAARRYYNLDYAENIVPARWQNKLSAFIPPTAAHAIDEAVDHILFTPRVHVMTRPAEADMKLKEQEIAENKRAFLAALWSGQTVIHDARKTLINEGMVAVKKILNWHYIPKRGTGRNATQRYRREIARLGADKTLWEFEILDNKTVTFDPSNHRNPRYAYVKMRIRVEEARRLFPKRSDPLDGMGDRHASPQVESWRDLPDLNEVEYIEFWSQDICDEYGEVIEEGAYVQWVEGEIVNDTENPYPYIPIAVEDAGFGTVRSNAEPHEIFVGITAKMRPVFEAEAKQMTAWEAVTELTAFGLYVARNRDPNKVWNVGPGEILDLDGAENDPMRESFEAVKLPEIPMGVIQLVQKTTQIANSVLKMETLGGQALPGVETATEADQQIRNASAKLSSPVAALERLVAKLSTWILMDIEEVIEAPVTVWNAPATSDSPSSVTVKPSDLRGYYMVTAELRTTDEEAVNMVKARFWAEMYRLIPFLSAWTAMEKGEITDEPQKEMIKRASEDIFMSEQMQTIRLMTAAQSFGEFAMFVQSLGGSAMGGGAPANGPMSGAGGGSQPIGDMMNPSVPAAPAGGAGAARDILQGPSQLRG